MKLELTFIAFCIAISVACIYGWIANVIYFANCDFEKPYKAEVIRGFGIVVAPVGVVAGYIDIKD